jgi:hypothetical protein
MLVELSCTREFPLKTLFAKYLMRRVSRITYFYAK